LVAIRHYREKEEKKGVKRACVLECISLSSHRQRRIRDDVPAGFVEILRGQR